ncbi:MAG: hypothetical protein M5T61_19070, partial [Acidimicrobiia bacterium]|nr:hypothetical protein [Acidimicrobiia bacterium]
MSPIVDPERRRESGRNAARRYAATPHGREKIRQYRRRRIEAVQAIKIECGCIDCGYREHPAALHFDHRDPDTKQFQVMKAIAAGRAWDDVMAE